MHYNGRRLPPIVLFLCWRAHIPPSNDRTIAILSIQQPGIPVRPVENNVFPKGDPIIEGLRLAARIGIN